MIGVLTKSKTLNTYLTQNVGKTLLPVNDLTKNHQIACD